MKSREQRQNLTAGTRRHGELGEQEAGRSGDFVFDHRITCDHPITRLRDAWNILQAMLLEIFDESAYRRFLLRTGLAHSAASYRAFQSERDATAAKPRCC
jgi:hypothetical protein